MTKSMIKRAIPMTIGALIVALVISIIPTSFLVQADKMDIESLLTLEEVEKVALKKIGYSTARITDYELLLDKDDYPYYLMEIITKQSKTIKIFSIKIHAINGDVKDLDVETIENGKIIIKDGKYYYSEEYYNDDFITRYEAKKIALKRVDDKTAYITDFKLELEGNIPYYSVKVETATHIRTIKINAETGKIIAVVTEVKDKDEELDDIDEDIMTKNEAIKVALKEIGKSAFLDEINLDRDDNVLKYEIDMHDDEYEYEIKIDAITGRVLKYEKELNDDIYDDLYDEDKDDEDDDDDDYDKKRVKKDKINQGNKNKGKVVTDGKYITKETAIEMALKKIGKSEKLVKIDEIEFDKDDNPPRYEIEMYDDKYEYEIEVHAISGAILKFERDED